jgi:hypothetical protein
MENKSVFIISNGSHQFYPKNSLTHFKNKLPIEIELNDNYEIAVESLGFSRTFKQISIPENDFPSFFISKSELPSYIISPPNEKIELRKSRIEKLTQELDYLSKKESSDGLLHKTNDTFPYYFKDNEIYNSVKLSDYFSKVNIKTGSNIKYQEDKISFSIPEVVGRVGRDENIALSILERGKRDEKITNSYWLVCHKSFVRSFNIIPYNIYVVKYSDHDFKTLKLPDGCQIIHKDLEKDEITFKIWLFTTKVYYKGEEYWAIHIQSSLHQLNCSDIKSKLFPDLIKLKCGNIEQQILNNSFSKDLVVFCPDFSKEENFFYHEFDSLQYVPLSNTILKDIEISICDENNSYLQLAPGTPSIVKLLFRKMDVNKKSFNARVSSASNSKFPNNTSASFKVKLPKVENLDRKWKVALTSISHPNNFNTFLCDEDSRSLQIIMKNDNEILEKHKLTLKEDYDSSEELFNELQTFFSSKNIGEVKESENRICFHFPRNCVLTIGNYLLRILGFTYVDSMSTFKKYTRFQVQVYTSHDFIKNEDGKLLFCFQEKIILNLLDPKYICLYANFISPTILGGEYHKILRIIPIREKKSGYIISEFKHREFHELQNTEINELEIQLRAHDGELINFKSKQNIILNLLFSNYIE